MKEVPCTELIVVESAFSVEAMVRGYHICRDVWTAVVNEELCCRREPFNAFHCHCGEGNHHCRPRSEEDIDDLLVVS